MAASRSRQARLLRRRLSMRLLGEWCAFTLAFVAIAALLNATAVPALADLVADATAPWRHWYYEDYGLEECLDAMGATAQEAIAQVVVVPSSEEGGGEEPEEEASQSGDSSQQVYYVTERGSSQGAWMTLREIQRATINHEVYLLEAAGGDWDVWYGTDGVSARDLSTYDALRSFKLPLAVALYLIGCLWIALRALNRSLRAFDEVTGAVVSLMRDRERPVELPSDLAVAQQELEELRLASLADERAAKAAERRKDELVAYLAHDVRTPLTSVIGYLSLLDEEPGLPEAHRRRYARAALAKAERLEGLIEEFFEITRYNLQAIPIERRTIEVALFLSQVAEESYPEAEARGLKVVVEAPEGETMRADPEKLARALGNVVRNAVAYADDGTEVRLVARTPQAAGEGGWELSVSDIGREISSAHLEAVFEKFYREDGARSTDGGRAGLGLAIAKEIVVAHGGTIEARSEEGLTTFLLWLPA